MNQFIKKFAAVLALILGVFSLTFGQNMYASSAVKTSNVSTEKVIETDKSNSNSSALNKVTELNFNSMFPNATEQKWTSNSNNSLVSFLNNGKKATASFNVKGKLSYVITNCAMSELPSDFSKAINNSYADYQLFHATEIEAFGETAYQAILENAAGFITLKYTVDGVEEIQTLKK